MTYEYILTKLNSAFSRLDEVKQAEYVEADCNDYVGFDVRVFPMSKFNEFCEKHFKGDYLKFATILQGVFSENWDFYEDDKWCIWDETEKSLHTSESIFDIIQDLEAFLVGLIDSDTLCDLGFSDEEIEDMLNSYEKYESEEE